MATDLQLQKKKFPSTQKDRISLTKGMWPDAEEEEV